MLPLHTMMCRGSLQHCCCSGLMMCRGSEPLHIIRPLQQLTVVLLLQWSDDVQGLTVVLPLQWSDDVQGLTTVLLLQWSDDVQGLTVSPCCSGQTMCNNNTTVLPLQWSDDVQGLTVVLLLQWSVVPLLQCLMVCTTAVCHRGSLWCWCCSGLMMCRGSPQ